MKQETTNKEKLASRKIMVLLGKPQDMPDQDFEKLYLEKHAKNIACLPNVRRYIANCVKQPDQKLMDAGWGWTAMDPLGVGAVDEVWADPQFYNSSIYADFMVIGAYEVMEYVIRPCYTNWPLGAKSRFIKRIGMQTPIPGKPIEEAMGYWLTRHVPKALEHHTGLSKYTQEHILQVLDPNSAGISALVGLHYWNLDAFQFGHFSRPDSAKIIQEDCANFRVDSYAVLVDEYEMKRKQ